MSGERLVRGMVLNFVPLNRRATTATGVFEVTVSVPSESRGASGTSANSSLTKRAIWRCEAMVIVFVAVRLPSARRSASVTGVSVAAGFVIATPTLLDKRILALAKRTIRVVIVAG